MIEYVGDDGAPSTEDNPQAMVFEWMDTDLWHLPSKPFRSGSPLPRIIARSLLEALVVIGDLGGTHGDVNPNNVFLSGAEGSVPVVQLGDLDNCESSRRNEGPS